MLAEAQDHPRGCGENIADAQKTAEPQGSPPRMRGKHLDEIRKLANMRITPADAGKTQPKPA